MHYTTDSDCLLSFIQPWQSKFLTLSCKFYANLPLTNLGAIV